MFGHDSVKRVSAYLGALNSDAAERLVLTTSRPLTITKAYLLNEGAVTANDTNYLTGSLINRGTGGSGATVAAQRSTTVAGGGISSKVPWELTLSSSAANLVLDAGEALSYVHNEGGSGQDLTDAQLVIEYVLGTGPAQ